MQNANLFLISLHSNDYFCNFLQKSCIYKYFFVTLRRKIKLREECPFGNIKLTWLEWRKIRDNT